MASVNQVHTATPGERDVDRFLELALQASGKSVIYFVMMIDEIRIKIASGLFEFSRHAVDQSLLRRISV